MELSLLNWLGARPWLAVVAALCLVGSVFARDRVLAWRHRRFACDARRVSVAAPPEVTPESAAALWATMTGVLTPPYRRGEHAGHRGPQGGVLTPSIWRRRLYG